MAATALRSRSSADWKARKPRNVPIAATAVQPDSTAATPWRWRPSDTALIAASAIP
jgi:hypothetical protein